MHQLRPWRFFSAALALGALLMFGSGHSDSRPVPARGEIVAALHGDKVSEGDLIGLARRRALANDYLRVVVFLNHVPAMRGLLKGKLKDEPRPLSGLRTILLQYNQPQQVLPSRMEHHLRLLRVLSQADGVRDNPENLQILQDVAAMIGFQMWDFWFQMRQRFGFRDEAYFLGGKKNPDDLLDFLVWKKQADKLKIVLTEKEIQREINQLAGTDVFKGKSFERDPVVRVFAKASAPVTTKDLLEAVRDELRVVKAQAALRGHTKNSDSGVYHYRYFLGTGLNPKLTPPAEFLKFYQRERTELNVVFLRLPVDHFVDSKRVRALRPGPGVLEDLYAKYKDTEPLPDKREPGFKAPPRIAVEYVIVRPGSPYYRDLARREIGTQVRIYGDPKGITSALRLLAPADVTPLGTGLVGRVAILAAPLAFDPLAQVHEAYLSSTNTTWLLPEDTETLRAPARLPDSAALRPENIGRTFGTLLGSPLGAGNAPATLATWYASGTIRHTQEGVRFYSTLMLAQATPALSGAPNLSAIPAILALSQSRQFPRDVVRPILMKQLEDRLAEGTARRNLAVLAKELERLKGDKEKAQAMVRKSAEEGQYEYHAMPRPRSLVEIIQALRFSSERSAVGKAEEVRGRKILRDSLEPLYDVLARMDHSRWAGSPDREPYSPERFIGELVRRIEAFKMVTPYGQDETSPAMVRLWRTETERDQTPHVLPFAAVREQVEYAWRLDQARKDTREKGVDIVKWAKEHKADWRELAREKRRPLAGIIENALAKQYAADFGAPFEIENMALLLPRTGRAARFGDFTHYLMPQEYLDVFPYPPATDGPPPSNRPLLEQLLALKDLGDATLVVDRPAHNFYVAVLAARTDRKGPQAIREFSLVHGKDPQRSPLWELFEENRAEWYRRQLRREAVGPAGVDENSKYRIPEAVRKRLENLWEAKE